MASEASPRSIAQLADEAASTIHFSNRFSCRAWLRSCDALTDQALQERARGDAEREFIGWARCATILLEHLPQHPQWRDLSSEERAQIRKQGHSCLDQLSRLKPGLSDRYEAWRARSQRAAQTPPQSSPSSRSPLPSAARPQQQAARSQERTLEDQKRALQVGSSSSSSSGPSRYDRSWQDGRSAYQTSSTPQPYRSHVPAAHPPSAPISYPALAEPRSSVRSSSSQSSLAPSSSYNLPPQTTRPSSLPPSRHPSPAAAAPQAAPSASSTTAPPSWAGLRTMNVPPSLVDAFLKRSAKNTKKRIETCGLLLGTLDSGMFTVRVLLLPVQKGTSDTCETLEEEKVFDFQDKRNLLTLGWIHTHPTQSCFMSSLDLHTHSGYQCMLPEAIAIVCAPQASPDLGIFRLTDPPGLQLIMSCTRHETFHPHPDVKGGIYTGGFGTKDRGYGHVRMREGQGVEVVDLRR